MRRVAIVLALAACAPRTTQPSPPPANTTLTAGTTPVAPLPVDALYDAWIDAVVARDAPRIESLLALPLAIYFDDGWTGARPAACRHVRTLHRLTTPAERAELATCIAATAFHAKITDPTHATGILPLDRLAPLVEAPVRGEFDARAADHDFVHGHSVGGSDFDFTLAVPRDGDGRATLVVLTASPGC